MWFLRNFLQLFVLTIIIPGALYSEPVTSEERFKELLKYHVSNIPELKPLWSATRNTVAADEVFLSGGILRGLIHYLHEEISRNGVAGARQARTPHVDELFLQEWSDSDLVSPREYQDWVKTKVPGTWDVLDSDFMKDSIRSGGPTIEKVMVNPSSVKDPNGALSDYLNGKLVFRSSPSGPNVGDLVGNTRLAQALRFLRMSQNLPEAEVTEDSWKALSRIKNTEWNSIQRGQDKDYWILKGLKKLYHSVDRNPKRLLEILKRADLLPLLARHHYSIPQDESGYTNGFERFLLNGGKNWSLQEKMDAAEVLGANLSEKTNLLNTVASLDSSVETKQKVQERKSLIQHIVQKFGENNLHPQRPNVQVAIQANGVQLQGAQNGRVLPNGAVEFQVPLVINGVPQKDCARIMVNIAIGQPQINIR